METCPIKPLFKCLGGKSKLASTLLEHFPPSDSYDYATYIEPFFGGGAVFCALYNSGALDKTKVVLADADHSVISILRQVQQDPKLVHRLTTAYLDQYVSKSVDDRSTMYYKVRDSWNEGFHSVGIAMFLRATSFNGLWRVSRKGTMNSPWGKYETFTVPTLEHLQAWQAALKGATLIAGDYRQAYSRVEVVDSISYIDPPYDGGFTAYTENGFTDQDQLDLIMHCATLTTGGGHVIYSNARTDNITGMLREWWPESITSHVLGKRSVAADAASRVEARELIVVGTPEE